METMRNGTLFVPKELGKVFSVPVSLVRPFPNQPRKFFDKTELARLARSIKAIGQNTPAKVKKLPDSELPYLYELVDGQRRYHAVRLAGLTELVVIVVEVKDEAAQFLSSVVSNFGSAPHDPIEIADAIQRFLAEGQSIEEIKDIFVRSDSWVCQHNKLLSLDIEVQRMMRQEVPEDDRLIFSVGLLLTDIPKELQLKFAQKIVKNRWGLAQAKHFIKLQAARLGLKVGDPNRTPRKDYAILCNLVRKAITEFRRMQEMPQAFFDSMFEAREVRDLTKLIGEVEQIYDNLNPLLTKLDNIKKKK